jgi:hypothetical protein
MDKNTESSQREMTQEIKETPKEMVKVNPRSKELNEKDPFIGSCGNSCLTCKISECKDN